MLVEVLCGSGQGIGGSSGPPCLGIDGAVSLGEGWGSDVVVGISSFLIPLSVPFPLVSGTSLWGSGLVSLVSLVVVGCFLPCWGCFVGWWGVCWISLCWEISFFCPVFCSPAWTYSLSPLAALSTFCVTPLLLGPLFFLGFFPGWFLLKMCFMHSTCRRESPPTIFTETPDMYFR